MDTLTIKQTEIEKSYLESRRFSLSDTTPRVQAFVTQMWKVALRKYPSAEILFRMGWAYKLGTGVKKSQLKGRFFLILSALDHHPDAEYDVFRFFNRWRLTSRWAMLWLRKACLDGANPVYYSHLALLTKSGRNHFVAEAADKVASALMAVEPEGREVPNEYGHVKDGGGVPFDDCLVLTKGGRYKN